MERTAMSRKEFERGAVLGRVREGTVSLKEAAELLHLSYRQAKHQFPEMGAPLPPLRLRLASPYAAPQPCPDHPVPERAVGR